MYDAEHRSFFVINDLVLEDDDTVFVLDHFVLEAVKVTVRLMVLLVCHQVLWLVSVRTSLFHRSDHVLRGVPTEARVRLQTEAYLDPDAQFVIARRDQLLLEFLNANEVKAAEQHEKQVEQ